MRLRQRILIFNYYSYFLRLGLTSKLKRTHYHFSQGHALLPMNPWCIKSDRSITLENPTKWGSYFLWNSSLKKFPNPPFFNIQLLPIFIPSNHSILTPNSLLNLLLCFLRTFNGDRQPFQASSQTLYSPNTLFLVPNSRVHSKAIRVSESGFLQTISLRLKVLLGHR